MERHPGDKHLVTLWRLLCEHIATDSDRLNISEPLRRNVLFVLREAWEKGNEHAHEDVTQNFLVPEDGTLDARPRQDRRDRPSAVHPVRHPRTTGVG